MKTLKLVKEDAPRAEEEVQYGQVRMDEGGELYLIVDARASIYTTIDDMKYIAVRLHQMDIAQPGGPISADEVRGLYPTLVEATLTYKEVGGL